jgi:hypothetical protein
VAAKHHHGGNFGQKKTIAVIQKLNNLNMTYSHEEDVIQAVTIIFLPYVGSQL